VDGPLFLAKDTHALSEPAFATALEVLAGNEVDVMADRAWGFTPTPALSHAILTYNRGRQTGLADGIVITPSHNPPEDGGFKYNPPHGGPADTVVTKWIEDRANQILAGKLSEVRRCGYTRRWRLDHTPPRLHFGIRRRPRIGGGHGSGARRRAQAVRRSAGRRGCGVLGPHRRAVRISAYRDARSRRPHVQLMTVDWDGKIRMDCSSPYAMAGLIALKDQFDVAFACDTDHDRHGVVTRSAGLLNPNHYLCVAISYLFMNRPGWGAEAGVGKTMVSSSLIDRVAKHLGHRLMEVPVGFKWFVDGLLEARWDSAARKAPALRSCAAMARSGPPIRTALLWACWRRDAGPHRQRLRGNLRRSDGAVRRTGLRAHRRARHPGAEGLTGAALARAGERARTGGRSHRSHAHGRARQRRSAGWVKGGDRARMVRSAAVGNRERLQLYAESFAGKEHCGRSSRRRRH